MVTIFSQADIKVPQAERTKFVRLEGEFEHAGIYSVLPGETLPQLVARAGGLTPQAYLFGSNFTRESTRVLQQLRLNDYLQNLELEIDRATIASSASVGAVDPAATAASQKPGSQIPDHTRHGPRRAQYTAECNRNREFAKYAIGGWRSLCGSFQAQHGECCRRGIRPEFIPVQEHPAGGGLPPAGRGTDKECRWGRFVHHPGGWLGGEPAFAERGFRQYLCVDADSMRGILWWFLKKYPGLQV